jgi:hypothetical protein
VIAGPGHLSPFRFTSIKLDLLYERASGNDLVLIGVVMRAGLFSLRMER